MHMQCICTKGVSFVNMSMKLLFVPPQLCMGKTCYAAVIVMI